MKSGTWTGRLVRSIALAALVATPVMLITTTGVAGATTVSDQDELESAFDSSTTTIDLTQDVVIDSSGDANCDDFNRNEGNALVIDGHGFSITKDCPGSGERIFKQDGGGAITFQNVTISGGVKDGGAGGALKTDGDVTVIDSTFHDNQALDCGSIVSTSTDVDAEGCNSPFGGAIYSTGSVIVTGSTFADNHSDKAGGAILTWNNITVSGSTFSGNSAGCEEGCWGSGGGFLAKGGVDVSDSSITGNEAGCEAYCEGSGGGFLAGGATSVVGSDVSGNTAGCDEYCEGDGGGFFASGFTEKANAEAGEVGVAAADPGEVIVANSTINGNVAQCDVNEVEPEEAKATQGDIPCGSGGGFFAYEADLVSVDQSTISGNSATCNPFIWDATSTEYGYYCGSGGGFYSAYSDTVDVNATTLDNNTATIYGGALSTGCVECNETTVNIVNSTVTANTSGASGAIDVFGSEEVLNLTHDTIVQNILDPIEELLAAEPNTEEPAANISANELNSFGTIVALPIGGVNCEFPEGGQTVEEQYNFSDDASCDFIVSTDDVATPNDPSLLALGDYGGPTQTMRPTGLILDGVLQNLSPVVDRIPAVDCVLDVDQRGISRPQTVEADACDIGAVEITAEEISEVSPADIVVPTPEIIQPRFTG